MGSAYGSSLSPRISCSPQRLDRITFAALETIASDTPLNQLALDGIHDGFEPVVSSQLLIDVMQVVPQRLTGDA